MLRHTAEQQALSKAVTALFTESPLASPRFSGSGRIQLEENRDTWRRLATELGVVGLLVPESLGGAGGTWSDVAVVMEAVGYTLNGAPYLSSAVLATQALLGASDGEVRAELLPRIVDGSLIGAVALGQAIPGRARAGRMTVSGLLPSVLDGNRADMLILRADFGQGEEIVVAEANQSGVLRRPTDSLDLTRPFASIALDDARVRVVADSRHTPALLRKLDAAQAVALAAEQAGGARRCLNDAVAYSRTRYQFARPIGSFQAVKHRAAQTLVDVTSIEAAARAAAQSFQELPGDSETELEVATAVVAATDGYLAAARTNMQIHGGIAFTWEATPHLHYRRARTTAGLLGGTTRWRARLASSLLDNLVNTTQPSTSGATR